MPGLGIRYSVFILLFAALGWAQEPQTTLLVGCEPNEKPKQVLSPVSSSPDGNWRAYVEVQVRDRECLHTTRLWVARGNGPYQLLYLMPPKRTAVENGMQILGWAKDSSMLLVRTAAWQWGSDAGIGEHVLGIDARSGMVYEPQLEAMLEGRKNRQCSFNIKDAGFGGDKDVSILVRAQFSTWFDVDETEADLPPAKRCGNTEETWSFNFRDGEIKQVPNTEHFRVFGGSAESKQR